jgi:hypothetical protein
MNVASTPRLLLLVACACMAIGAASRPAQAQFAIVTHGTSPLNDITIDNARKLFGGDMATPGGQLGVGVAFYEPAETDFFKALLGKTPDGVHKRWAMLVFQGEAVALPRAFSEPAAIKKWVSTTQNAIAFLPASAVDGSVKVVKIGGKSPSDAGYLGH